MPTRPEQLQSNTASHGVLFSSHPHLLAEHPATLMLKNSSLSFPPQFRLIDAGEVNLSRSKETYFTSMPFSLKNFTDPVVKGIIPTLASSGTK